MKPSPAAHAHARRGPAREAGAAPRQQPPGKVAPRSAENVIAAAVPLGGLGTHTLVHTHALVHTGTHTHPSCQASGRFIPSPVPVCSPLSSAWLLRAAQPGKPGFGAGSEREELGLPSLLLCQGRGEREEGSGWIRGNHSGLWLPPTPVLRAEPPPCWSTPDPWLSCRTNWRVPGGHRMPSPTRGKAGAVEERRDGSQASAWRLSKAVPSRTSCTPQQPGRQASSLLNVFLSENGTEIAPPPLPDLSPAPPCSGHLALSHTMRISIDAYQPSSQEPASHFLPVLTAHSLLRSFSLPHPAARSPLSGSRSQGHFHNSPWVGNTHTAEPSQLCKEGLQNQMKTRLGSSCRSKRERRSWRRVQSFRQQRTGSRHGSSLGRSRTQVAREIKGSRYSSAKWWSGPGPGWLAGEELWIRHIGQGNIDTGWVRRGGSRFGHGRM